MGGPTDRHTLMKLQIAKKGGMKYEMRLGEDKEDLIRSLAAGRTKWKLEKAQCTIVYAVAIH